MMGLLGSQWGEGNFRGYFEKRGGLQMKALKALIWKEWREARALI